MKPVSFGQVMLAGLCTAMIGGVLVGLAESQLLLVKMADRFAEAAEFPASFVLGATGRFVLTHFVFWSLAGLLWSVPLAWWFSARSRRRAVLAPECVYVLVFIVLAGVVVIPADLFLIGRLDAVNAVVWLLGSLIVAVIAFLVVWWASQHRWFRAYRVFLRAGAVAAVVLAGGAAVAMSRSPFCGAEWFSVADGGGWSAAAEGGRPNILWIVLDTMRADHMSCYGYGKPTTPFIDQVAAESMVYERAIANANWTVPSHASMFTGLAGRQHGATREHAWLDDEHVTIAELLREHGYLTASFSNNPHVSAGRNFTQGFEVYPQTHMLTWLDKMSLVVWCEWLGVAPPLPWLENDLGGKNATAYIAWWLDCGAGSPRRTDKPWMIFVNFLETHLPYDVPRSYRRLFMDPAEVRRSYALRRRAYGDLLFAIHYRRNLADKGYMDEADLAVLAKQYDASIRYLDRRVEELLGVLERRGLLANTIVVMTSDHGEMLGEQGWWEHAYGVYHPVVHVPLIIRYPGGSPAGRVDVLVQPSDLFATVASWAGVQVPNIEGRQARDLNRLNEVNGAERMVVAEYLTPWLLPVLWADTNVPGFDRGEVVRELRGAYWGPRYKFIWSSDGRHELYDVAVDPAESHNLASREPGVAGRFGGRVEHWARGVPPYVPTGKFMPDLPREVAEQLRALGYFE